MNIQPTKKRVLILGGGYAGLMAASRITRSRIPVAVTLVDARPEFVQRIRLHEVLGGGQPATFPYAPLLERKGVRFVQGHVELLNPEGQKVVARNASGARLELDYDFLVLAVGSRVNASVPGVAEYAIRLNEPQAVREQAEHLPGLAASQGRVLVVGGGLTGIEASTEIAERYPDLNVMLATSDTFGGGFSEDAVDYLRKRFSALRIEVREGIAIEAMQARAAHVQGGGALPFDFCVWAGGFEASPLAREAGLATSANGQAIVSADLRSISHPDVFVAGDAARIMVADRYIRMSCASAMPAGAHVGENVRRVLAGKEPLAFDFGFVARNASLGRKDGLIQLVNRADQPGERVWTGGLAVRVKELVCRLTFALPRAELRMGLPLYSWPSSGPAGRTASRMTQEDLR